jgi:hypothetical protein
MSDQSRITLTKSRVSLSRLVFGAAVEGAWNCHTRPVHDLKIAGSNYVL